MQRGKRGECHAEWHPSDAGIIDTRVRDIEILTSGIRRDKEEEREKV